MDRAASAPSFSRVGPISTASSASRTNVACRSAAVYTAMTRRAGRPSAFHSRTALISRMAGSPRLTTATRWKAKAGRAGWFILLPTERGAHVVAGAPGPRRRRCGLLQDVQHHLVRHDGRVELHHGIPADRAGPEAGREDAGPAGDRAVTHGVVECDRDARRRHVPHPVHVEVQLVS